MKRLIICLVAAAVMTAIAIPAFAGNPDVERQNREVRRIIQEARRQEALRQKMEARRQAEIQMQSQAERKPDALDKAADIINAINILFGGGSDEQPSCQYVDEYGNCLQD